MALKLISFIGNIRDINSHREDLPYVQTKGMSFFFAFPLYVLFGHCHGIQIDMKYLGSRGRAKKAVMCKYQLLEPNREVNWNLQFWALPYHISKLTRVLDAQVAVPLLIYQQHFHRCLTVFVTPATAGGEHCLHLHTHTQGWSRESTRGVVQTSRLPTQGCPGVSVRPTCTASRLLGSAAP